MSKSDETYSPEETARRRDEAIRRALSTPPKPNSEYIGKSARAKQRQRDKARKAALRERGKGEA